MNGNFRSKLNKEYPPADMTRILQPGHSINSSYTVQINLPRERGKKYSFSPWKQMSFAELKELRSVYLQFYGCDFLKYGLENKADKVV